MRVTKHTRHIATFTSVQHFGFPVAKSVCGCNVENASYSLSICAERVAVSTAVANGDREFQGLAIASVGGVSPCGACRQFLSEFVDDMQIIMADVLTGGRQIRTLTQLLPDAFDASNLPVT